MTVTPKKSVSVLMPMPLYDKLTALAKAENCKLSAYIRQALKQHIRQKEETQ